MTTLPTDVNYLNSEIAAGFVWPMSWRFNRQVKNGTTLDDRYRQMLRYVARQTRWFFLHMVCFVAAALAFAYGLK